MEKLSNEERIKTYNKLYLSQDNDDKVIDYSDVVMRYKTYLSLFFDEESSLYYDVEFLVLAIDGFNYLYKNFFGDEDVDLDIIPSSLCKHDAELRKKNAAEEQAHYTDSDVVLVYSLKLAMMFRDMDMIDEYNDEIQRALFNSYVIEGKEKGCGKNGMEDRKYYH